MDGFFWNDPAKARKELVRDGWRWLFFLCVFTLSIILLFGAVSNGERFVFGSFSVSFALMLADRGARLWTLWRESPLSRRAPLVELAGKTLTVRHLGQEQRRKLSSRRRELLLISGTQLELIDPETRQREVFDLSCLSDVDAQSVATAFEHWDSLAAGHPVPPSDSTAPSTR